MKLVVAVSLFIVICGTLQCDAKQLPSFIQKCSRSDINKLGECLLKRTEELRPRLLKGIPELKLPPIEPLHIPKLEIHTGGGSSVSFDASITDILAYGVKDFRVLQMRIDFETKKIIFHNQFPQLHIQGTYTINGKVLLFEISATGLMDANVTEVDAISYMNFKLTTKNGKQYIDIGNDYKLDHKYEKVSIYFNDIFKGNQQLTEEINKAIGDNIENLSQDVNPLVFEAIHLLVMGIINPVFLEHSVDELFN